MEPIDQTNEAVTPALPEPNHLNKKACCYCTKLIPVTAAMGDDRKAFDELWTLSQMPQHPYQDLAHRAAENIEMSSTTFRQDAILMDRLQQLNFANLLQYYRNTSHIYSPSVLYAADGNKHMTETQKVDFMATMIDEDGSF